jgi:hypothetical protein
MEIEIYVQRNLKLPSLSYYFESIVPKLRKLGHVNDEQVTLISASFPQLVQTLQSQAVQVLPDKSEELDKEFALILNELSTVDPLLAYRISERHIITPIQKMDSVLGEMLRGLGIDTKKDELEIQLLNQFASSQKSKMIDELLSDLRKDILKVATKIGKGTLSEIELYFSELDIKRRKQAENMAGELVKLLPKKVQDAKS